MNSHLHPRLLAWWHDNPVDPDRPTLNNPDVQRLITAIAPASQARDLGGVMSLNVGLEPAGLVLRVHQPFVSRQRLLSVQHVRTALADRGLIVPLALPWDRTTVLRCGRRWAEIEAYIPHKRTEPTLNYYLWLFAAMGTLHHELAALTMTVPRPLIATYAPPGTLLRWLPVTTTAVEHNPEAADIARSLRDLIGLLRRQWLPASSLPQQLVHGDVRLSNVCQTSTGQTVYLDFGFLARRPRVHDLAYSLAFMLLALHQQQPPEDFPWQAIPRLIETYEATTNTRLTNDERKALAPYTAAIPLHSAALSGFALDPPALLRERLPFLRLSAWLLAHPEALQG